MSVVSMTGFGRAEGVHEATRWIWEARSVNGRGLDLRARLPGGWEGVEAPARAAAQKLFKRGSIQISLTLKREERLDAGAPINMALIESFLRSGQALIDSERVARPSWDGLLSLRGVLGGDVEGDSPEARAALEKTVLAGLEIALTALASTRVQEGEKTKTVLLGLIDRVGVLTAQAGDLAAAQPAALIERIRTRVAAAAPEVQVDPQRLAQEAALAAARADIREELDRLMAHVDEARSLIQGAEPAGRRLDFLAQEFNREANTLCSKSSDLALTRLGLDLKTAIDQMREQAANVE
jgi:uncharacterized protein (TIGR00255 family)